MSAMGLVMSYVVFIVVGPLVFLSLIRPEPTRQRFAMGVFSAVGLIVSGFVMRDASAGFPLAAVGWLIAMWLGWIVTIAMAVQGLTLRLGRGQTRRWGATVGAAAVTLPWFGLSLAMTAG